MEEVKGNKNVHICRCHQSINKKHHRMQKKTRAANWQDIKLTYKPQQPTNEKHREKENRK